MEMMIIGLLLVVVAVLLISRRGTASRRNPARTPEPEHSDARELELRIGEFMEQDQFLLMIQPVVDFQTGGVCGGEVLSRLKHPERGMIFPDVFLPAVDAAGLYPRFDRYIFTKCCAWMSRTAEDGEKLETLSCNFSRKTLSEATIAEDLTRIADDFGIAHNRLAIEITERERETDARQLCENLDRLKEAGFRIFLDDYGNGVTSVKDLMRYPLDIVKIDRSVLMAADTRQGKAAYRALVTMALEMGDEVACEGIETEEQCRFAKEVGCRYGQGFLFFRPMDTQQVFDMIEKSSIRKEEL